MQQRYLVAAGICRPLIGVDDCTRSCMRRQHRIFVCSPGVGGAAGPGVGAAAGQATRCVAVAEQSLRMEHICSGGALTAFSFQPAAPHR